MTTSACSQEEDAMQHAARFSSHHSQQLCRWYARSGTCRTKSCKLSHIGAAESGVTAQASYDDRLWTLSSTEDNEPHPGQQTWRFSVASYNILADKYARHYRSYLYHDVPATYLDWHHRRSAIMAELAYLLPDVICLQEVDRYEDLEAELEQLGYSGIYLQRDGGRRDGCATFWRHSLLRPAVVRQVRFSHHDLKDNVALLVLFEPCHSTAQHGALSSSAAAAAAEAAAGADGMFQQQQQQQQYDETLEQLEEQQQQEQYGQSPQTGGVLSQWLPKGWLWSNSSNSSSSHHARSSQLLLRPVHPSHADVAGSSPGCVYQVPVQLQQQQQQAGGSRSSFEVAAGSAAGASYASHGSSSSKGHKKGQRRNSSGSTRNSLERQMQGAVAGELYSAAASQQQQQQQGQVPDWVRCALLVANTHIIFTPEKGEVKLGQARLLVQEVGQMAQWYLEQQQQQGVVSAPNGSTTGGSRDTTPAAAAAAVQGADDGVCGAVAPANTQAVAAILTGDYNATPNSPLYAYMSKGVLDLQTVNKRNVSHMVGGSHHHHHKGYRGFRRANRRRSVELQQQQQQQQQGEAMAAAGYQLQQQQQQQGLQPVPATVAAADGSAGRSQSGPFAASGNGISDTAAATVPPAQQQGNSSWRASPGLGPNNSSSSSVANGAVSIPISSMQRQDSSGSAGPPFGSSPPPPAATAAAASPQRQNSLGQKQYRWSDREVRRAAGMSYDELVEASMSYLSETDDDSPLASSDDPITRAAAAFAATAAAGSGAAAAATAAAAAADAPAKQESASILGSSPVKAFFAAAVSRSPSSSQPLLLQHGLNLKSSYKTVLGQEPDYTSSHSQFMDTCDYIWYTSSPLTQQQQQQQASNNQPGAGSSNGSSAHQPGSSSSSAGGQYELRPVAVLQPPDGMKLNKGLPAKALGSDHICLLTDFEMVLK